MFLYRNDFFMTLLLFIRCISASIWKWHALFTYSVYGVEESEISGAKLGYFIFFNRNHFVVKTLLPSVSVIEKGNYHIMNPFDNYFL